VLAATSSAFGRVRKLQSNSVWNELSKVDVSAFTEKKNGFTYLSWADAWTVLKDHYPDAMYVKHIFDGLPFMMDVKGYAYVQVTVRIPSANTEASEIMPVLNHANKAIQHPDSFQVNTSLQRCLAKAIANLGLGMYVYRGEDLPDGSSAPTPPPQAKPAPAGFSKPQALSLEQEINLAPDIDSLKALFNRVSLRVTPEQKTLFSKRKQELMNG